MYRVYVLPAETLATAFSQILGESPSTLQVEKTSLQARLGEDLL